MRFDPSDTSHDPMRISVIGTVHDENGRANVAELRAILDRLQPDVVFVEIPPASLAGYLDGTHGNLESAALVLYRKHRPVDVVPVDVDEPGDGFFRDSEEMFRKIERTSSHYRRLMDQNNLETRDQGFPYLNSNRCAQAWADIYKEVSATLEWTRDPRLRQIYDSWSETHDRRERAMLENINRYCLGHAFSHGVLLVGAAHTKGMLQKALEQRGAGGTPSVSWKLDSLS